MQVSLFQPFGQVEIDISRKRDGISLGLAANKKLVELMGGEIWTKSGVGKGSTFYFTIEAEIVPDDGTKIKPERMTKSISEELAEQHPLRVDHIDKSWHNVYWKIDISASAKSRLNQH